MKVLVVDDHPTVRQLTMRLLSLLGHQPLEASDARQAEVALTEHPGEVGVVLLDLCLAGVDGVAVADRLEASRGELRILFMSGEAKEVIAARELAGPRRAFIEKPFSLNGLSSAINGLVGQ
jgi:two-component system cell cycle sensor histidine kinase/response regulator CckA